MSLERRDNDKIVEETKKQIDDIEKKVSHGFISFDLKRIDYRDCRRLNISGRMKGR